MVLLEESWNELFLLCVIEQYVSPDANPSLFSSPFQHQFSGKSNDCNINYDFSSIRALVDRFRNLGVESMELADMDFLRAVTLFKPDTCGLKVIMDISLLHTKLLSIISYVCLFVIRMQ